MGVKLRVLRAEGAIITSSNPCTFTHLHTGYFLLRHYQYHERGDVVTVS